jgi:2'-5' RNA ligase
VIRAFIAVDLDPQVIERIGAAILELKPRLPGVRWIPPTNFHLTLKFLAAIREEQVDAIHAALAAQLQPFSRCAINAKGLGVFPDSRRPRILWVGVESAKLALLAAQIETALTPLGFAPEARGFKAHLTIGRWREPGRISRELVAVLERWRGVEFGQSQIDTVNLFQSVLKPEGAEYRRLKTIPLT